MNIVNGRNVRIKSESWCCLFDIKEMKILFFILYFDFDIKMIIYGLKCLIVFFYLINE